MLVTDETLRRVDEHWAVQAVSEDGRGRGLVVAKARLVRAAVAQQMSLDFQDQPDDEQILEKLATAYEVAAIEGLSAVLSGGTTDEAKTKQEQCYAGAWRAFEMQRLLPVPEQDEHRIFHILHLAALAYCGDRWSDLRRWLAENEEHLAVPDTGGIAWDRRLLFRLFECWIRLLRKRSWEDLAAISQIVADLRSDQAAYEAGVLDEDGGAGHSVAFRLIALYHWAKATELLSVYMMQGTPTGVDTELDKHFEASRLAAATSQDGPLEVLQRWLHVAARRMVAGSVWWVARAVNSRVTQFIEEVTKSQSMFELLPPQRAALQEQGLLDPAHRAVVVEMPTSGGKTLLAEFRMLQALNQFEQEGGWVAYVAPTRALVAQITRRLRRDFGPCGLTVEQLTGAIEIDAFEDDLLTASADRATFHVLVATPEKLQLVLRNNRAQRPLALIVLDEAHNIEDEERGMRIELLLATVRRECDRANFLLLMPFVPNGEDLANWLAPQASRSISIGTGVWKPNERIVGLFRAEPDDSVRAGWQMVFETLTTTPKTVHLRGVHRAGPPRPLAPPRSSAISAPGIQTGAMSKIFSDRGTSIAVATNIPHVWSMARRVRDAMRPLEHTPNETQLVQRFLATEISSDFELIDMLSRGVAVHHAGLSDEARTLIEWLAELSQLRVLCATTTIAQGINFPVSSIFMASNKYPYGHEMTLREFWNLAGRAGRFGQDSVGVVGVAEHGRRQELTEYMSRAHGHLVSRLVRLLSEVEQAHQLDELAGILHREQWRDFRCYVAHLWAEKQDLEAVLADTEQLLRSTFGYSVLRAEHTDSATKQANALLKATREYVQRWVNHPENTVLADATGFAPEGVRSAIIELNQLESRLTPNDWEPGSIFGDMNQSSLPNLIGIMLKIPELAGSLEEIQRSGLTHQHVAGITAAWVNGKPLRDIAEQYFQRGGGSMTNAITAACKAIYRTIANSGPWGLSALTKLPTSGLDFDQLPEDAARRINALPAMIYHGVRTESAVLMRMNAVPRSVAEPLGERFSHDIGQGQPAVMAARDFLKSLSDQDWGTFRPVDAAMSGQDYRRVWEQLSGEVRT